MRQPVDPADEGRGLYDKFIVTRTDGQSEIGQLHNGCLYFPLDLTHDPHAIKAILAYADSCEKDNPKLARDLRAIPPVYTCQRCGSGRVHHAPLIGASVNTHLHCGECGHDAYINE